MSFWSGYGRFVRDSGGSRKVWLRRGWCGACRTSHALVPSFCLLGRLDVVEVVGEALSEVVGGRSGVRPVAARLDVPHTTARDWLRRFARRAGVLTAGFAALVVKLCGVAPVLPADPSHQALGAIALAYVAARSRAGPLLLALWPFAAVVTGGKLLSTNTDPPWSGLGGCRFMPPVP